MSWENLFYAYQKTKVQISCMVTAPLISHFVFTSSIIQILLSKFIWNFKPLAISCVCTAQYVSELVKKPKDRFSHDVTQLRQTQLVPRGYNLLLHMSLIMRKLDFCICEKNADQLCCHHEADQRLCFRYTGSTIPLLPKSEISSL